MHNKIAYSVREAAAATGLSRTTLYALMKSGELIPAKIGTRTLISHKVLEALIERNTAA